MSGMQYAVYVAAIAEGAKKSDPGDGLLYCRRESTEVTI